MEDACAAIDARLRTCIATLARHHGLNVRLIEQVVPASRRRGHLEPHPVSVRVHPEDKAGLWRIQVLREPHRFEGHGTRYLETHVADPEDPGIDALAERLIDRIRVLQRRDEIITATGGDPASPPAWAYTIHRIVRLVLQTNGMSIDEAVEPATRVLPMGERDPITRRRAVESRMRSAKSGDVVRCDMAIEGDRCIADVVIVRGSDGRNLLEIRERADCVLTIRRHLPETMVQTLSGLDLARVVAYGAFGPATGVHILDASTVEEGTKLRLADVRDDAGIVPWGTPDGWRLR